jgi:hypothetical protein
MDPGLFLGSVTPCSITQKCRQTNNHNYISENALYGPKHATCFSFSKRLKNLREDKHFKYNTLILKRRNMWQAVGQNILFENTVVFDTPSDNTGQQISKKVLCLDVYVINLFVCIYEVGKGT